MVSIERSRFHARARSGRYLRIAIAAAFVSIICVVTVDGSGTALAAERSQTAAGIHHRPVQIDKNVRRERQALLKLFAAKDWVELDFRLRAIFEAHRSGKIADGYFEEVVQAFRRDAPGVREDLGEWVTAMPDAWTAAVASGFYYYNLAWKSRGTRQIGHVTPEQVTAMRRIFRIAVAEFERAITLDPKLAVAYIGLMDIAKTGIKISKKRQSARQDLEEMYARGTKQLPAAPSLHKAYVHCLSPMWGGSEARQVRLIEMLKKRFDGKSEFRWLHDFSDAIDAGNRIQDRDFDAAIAIYDRIIRRSNDMTAHMRRAEILMHLKRPKEARRALRNAASARPYDPRPHFRIWIMGSHEERVSAGFVHLENALKLDPLNPDYLLPHAHRNIEQGLLVEAEADLRNALFYGAFDERVHNAWASLHKKHGDTAKAIQSFRRAVSIAPQHPYFWSELGDLTASTDECGAKRAYQQLLKLCASGKRCSADRLKVVRKRVAEMKCLSEQHREEGERDYRAGQRIGEGGL